MTLLKNPTMASLQSGIQTSNEMKIQNEEIKSKCQEALSINILDQSICSFLISFFYLAPQKLICKDLQLSVEILPTNKMGTDLIRGNITQRSHFTIML